MAASGLPKLADFKKAIADVKTASAKYKNAQDSLQPSQTAIDKAESALNKARDTLNTLQSDYNNKSYLNNPTYQSAYSTYQTAAEKANSLENYWRSRDWLNSDSGYQNAANAYNTAKDFIDSGKYLQNNSAYQTAANNLTTAQQKYETAKNYFDSEEYLNKNSTYQNLLSARQTAEQKLNEARDFYDSGRYYRDNSTYNNNVNTFNDAERKLNDLRNWKDSGRYLEENSTYKNALNDVESKLNTLRDAESKLDNWSGNRSGSSWNSAVSAKEAADRAVSAAYTARDKASEAASNAADTLIRNQDNTKNTAEQNVNKTRESLETAANKARETAETTFNTVRENIDRTKDTLRETAEKAVNTAQTAYENAQPAVDKAKETAANAANTAKNTAENNKNIAENKADEIAWNNWQTASKAADTYKGKTDTIANGLEIVANRAVETQKSAVDTQNGVYETAQNKYKDNFNQIAPDLENYNAKVADVSNYAQVFKDNVSDITKYSEITEAKNLLNQFNEEIKSSGLDDLKSKMEPVFSDVASTAKFDQKLEQAKGNYLKDFGLPTLNANQVDAALLAQSKLHQRGVPTGDTNTLLFPDYQKQGDDRLSGVKVDGLNLKSINANIRTGAALFGVYRHAMQDDKRTVKFTGDFKKAAEAAKINIDGMTQQQAWEALNEVGKDFYAISSRTVPGITSEVNPETGKVADHFMGYYRKDGDQLVPVIDEKGDPYVTPFTSTWHQPYEDFNTFITDIAPIASLAMMIFAPQIGAWANSTLGALQVSAAVAPTAFTVGLPAVTLTQTIGATAVSSIANSAINAVVSKLTGGDTVKAITAGAIGPVISGSADQILNRVGITPDVVNKIAEVSNLQPVQVTKMLANGLVTGATGVALGDPNALNNAILDVAGQFSGSQAQNLVSSALQGADPKVIAAATNTAGNVVNIGVQVGLNGGDVGAAIQNAAPGIIADAAQASNAVKPTTPAPIEDRSTYPEPTLDPSDVAKPDSTLGNYDVTKPDLIAGLTPEQVGQNQDNEFNLLGKKSPWGNPIVYDKNNNLFELTEDDIIPYVGESGVYIPTGKVDKNGNEIVEGPSGLYVKYKSKNFNELGYQNTFNVPYDPETEELPTGSIFSFGTPPPPNVANKISLIGSGSTSTIDENKFGIVAQDYGTPEEKLQAVTDVETWEKSVQNDPKASAQEKTKAAEITKAIKDANVTATQPEVQQPVVTPPVITPPESKPPEVKPTETKPTETKPDTTTTVGGSSTAAPAPALTPQQKADELQKQADAAESQVMNAANNYILNPTVENKAKASAAVLDYELAAKIADAAKADLVSKPEIPLPNDGGSPTNQLTEAPSGSQQTGSQQPTQTPGSQEPAQPGTPQPAQPGVPQPSQPGLPLPAQPGADQPSQTTSTLPGSGTSNVPGTSTTAGLGGTGAGGAGTSGSGTTGTGTGTGSGVGPGTDITGILSALAGAFGSGKVSTGAGGLSQIPAGYVATTSPLAKRPIGDLFPVSFTMMTPEEIAARSSTKIVRRGGLVSMRK